VVLAYTDMTASSSMRMCSSRFTIRVRIHGIGQYSRSNIPNINSLRRHSPFSIVAILYVSQRIRDAGSQPSELQKDLKGYAEEFGTFGR
jgi:hypothetical protein